TSISTPSGAAATKWRCPNSYQSASKVASNPKCRTRAVVAEVQRELGERVAEAAERYGDRGSNCGPAAGPSWPPGPTPRYAGIRWRACCRAG
ncbi:hypothetical protein, partial [Streptomyces albicerus]|uniref:hypothetical protein n=1 Tax=Streptomyces albicerus TaxID=2569859 RepID=UPI001CEDA896